MSLIPKQTSTTTDETFQNQTNTIPLIDLLGLNEMKRDNPGKTRTNCSTNCARKTFKELVFINKLFRSMENMYGDINDRLDEITVDSGRAKRSVPKQERKKGQTHKAAHEQKDREKTQHWQS